MNFYLLYLSDKILYLFQPYLVTIIRGLLQEKEDERKERIELKYENWCCTQKNMTSWVYHKLKY
jgi:hypothetical protein